MRKLLCAVLAVLLLVGTLPASAMALDTVTREYEDQAFSKISNPTAGPGTPDGINTNDITGYAANRLNSYAWARDAVAFLGQHNHALVGITSHLSALQIK